MHVCQTIEVAALVSFHSDTWIAVCPELDDDALSEYWVASRCRLDQWGRSLRSLSDSSTLSVRNPTPSLLVLAEEITLARLLTRLMVAFTATHDRLHPHSDSASIAHNLWDAHQEIDSRLERLLRVWWSTNSPRRRHVRSLARRTEQWNDLLLGYLALTEKVGRWAYEADRVREFAYDVRLHRRRSSNFGGLLLTKAIRSAFEEVRLPAGNPVLNQRIANAVIGIFGQSLFGSHGLPRTPWMLRAESQEQERRGSLAELFVNHDLADTTPTSTRWRCTPPQ